MADESREDRLDADLMERFKAGDHHAFKSLMDRQNAWLFPYIAQRTPNAAVAEELLQETWFKVIRSAPRFQVRPGRQFYGYLKTIAYNHIQDYWRKKHRRPTVSIDAPTGNPNSGAYASTLGDALADEGDSAYECARRAELQAHIDRCAKALKPRYRTVYEDRIKDEIPLKEIAEKLTIAESKEVTARMVEGRVLTARKNLQECLREAGINVREVFG